MGPAMLIPLVAVAMPLGIVAIVFWYKARDKELQIQREMRIREIEHQQRMRELEVEREKAKAAQVYERTA